MVFQFDGAKVRVVVKDGAPQGAAWEPWFVAKDVADVLGYVDTDQAIRDHCKNIILVGGVEMTGASDYKGSGQRAGSSFFFRIYPPVYFPGGEVEDSILKAPLIPWKYRGFYVGSKVRARRRVKGIHNVETLSFDRKIFEGLRRSTRRPFPPWRGRKIDTGEN